MSIELDLTRTLIVALTVLFAGTFLARHVPFLLRYSIPVPVIGGIVFAAATRALFALGGVELQFHTALQAPLMLPWRNATWSVRSDDPSNAHSRTVGPRSRPAHRQSICPPATLRPSATGCSIRRTHVL